MGTRRLVIVGLTGVEVIEAEPPYPDRFGAKAKGLLWLPEAWSPPFLVTTPDVYQHYCNQPATGRPAVVDSIMSNLDHGLEKAGMASIKRLYLRSNAQTESISERGKYSSHPCTRVALREGFCTFFDHVAGNDSREEEMGVAVQGYVEPRLSGNLSNARRVAEEYRDAIAEVVDPKSGAVEEFPLTYRRWRNPTPASPEALVCTRREDLVSVLREPLAYAAQRRKRIQYEWVWDGAFVHIVQADEVTDESSGRSPDQFLGSAVSEGVESIHLRAFRRAREKDTQVSGKLRNHLLYKRLGFQQPPLYLLAQPQRIQQLLSGEMNSDITADLHALTRRPLMIRTDLAEGLKTLLPRSNLLYSADEAIDWLTGPFAREIARMGLRVENLRLIAHHYIPAIGSALSAGTPDDRHVYIEALWGVPEGLYYYTSDAYLVDTRRPNASDIREKAAGDFRVKIKRRYKGHFVAPTAEGKFGVWPTARPWDWGDVLGDKGVAQQIALFTRRLAHEEKAPVTVMWFLNCAPWTGLPTVIPWYHDRNVDSWTKMKGHLYERNAKDKILALKTRADLEQLEKEQLLPEAAGPGRKIVIRLNPNEDAIIRDEDITQRIGKVAVRLGAVVELQGGVLSHLYYTLIREGANVAVRHPPPFRDEVLEFHKLVRDKVPEAVVHAGESVRIYRLSPEALRSALKAKLVEEAFEVRDASGDELVEEVADVLEVIDELANVCGISKDELRNARAAKREKRGGFREGILLRDTTLTVRNEADVENEPTLIETESERRAPIVLSRGMVSAESTSAGPIDVRSGEDFREYVQTANVGLTSPEWTVDSPDGIRLSSVIEIDSIQWSLEGKREGSRIRLRLKIRLGEGQLRLPYE